MALRFIPLSPHGSDALSPRGTPYDRAMVKRGKIRVNRNEHLDTAKLGTMLIIDVKTK